MKGKSKVVIGPTTFSFDTTEAGTSEGAAEFVETDVTATPRDHIQLQQLFQFSVMLSKNNLGRAEIIRLVHSRVKGINSANSEAVVQFVKWCHSQINSNKPGTVICVKCRLKRYKYARTHAKSRTLDSSLTPWVQNIRNQQVESCVIHRVEFLTRF